MEPRRNLAAAPRHFTAAEGVDKKIPRSDSGLAWLEQSRLCSALPGAGIRAGCCPLGRKAPAVALRMSHITRLTLAAPRCRHRGEIPGFLLFSCSYPSVLPPWYSFSALLHSPGIPSRALLNIPVLPAVQTTREHFCDDKGAEQSAWT